MKIVDKIKQKWTSSQKRGVVIGVWEKDEYLENNKNEMVKFASKGEFKVRLENAESENNLHTFSKNELEKI